MRSLTATIMTFVLCASPASAQSNQMITVTRPGSQPSAVGSSDNFTGSVRVDSRFQGTASAQISGATIIFEPGGGRLGIPIRLVKL
jgi:hypothetical protein